MRNFVDTVRFNGQDVEFDVRLTTDQLVQLDGECGDEVQAVIDLIKRSLMVATRHDIPLSWAIFISRVVDIATNDGILVFYKCPITHCRVSGKTGEYVRSPARRRQPSVLTQKTFVGVELKSSFVSVKNSVHLGCDALLFDRLRPYLASELANVVAEIPEQITGEPPKYRKESVIKHAACDWEGPESATFADGYYGHTCPGCGAQSSKYSMSYKTTGAFVVTPTPPRPQKNEVRLPSGPPMPPDHIETGPNDAPKAPSPA